MASILSRLLRRKEIKSKLFIEKDGMSRHSIKVCIDENMEGVNSYLREKGYNVIVFPKGISDPAVHDFLHEKNVKFFFTKNYVDFEEIHVKVGIPKYVMFKISINRPDYLMADIFEWLIMNYYRLKENKSTDVFSGRISNVFLRQLGCKK